MNWDNRKWEIKLHGLSNYKVLLSSSPVERHLGLFQLLVIIINKAAMNMCMQAFVWT